MIPSKLRQSLAPIGRCPLGVSIVLCAVASMSARGAQSALQAQLDPPARALLMELCASPRLAGTTGSEFGARVVSRHLAAAGFEVELDRREVLLSYPRRIEFAIYPDAWSDAPLAERIERFDPDAIPPGDVPKYNAWSASGTVRGLVVDAGHGVRADFERLKSLGVELRGAIALVRYGQSYRGIKVDLATQYGCSGVLLFDDPASDGPAKGPTWPAGPWKPDWEAQRGSISPMGRIPGDPSTPGWASPKPGEIDAQRIVGAELAAALPRIPCLPIGSREAQLLIEKLAPVDVTAADGAKHSEPLGPGPVQARLALDVPRELRPIVNVIARLRGKSETTVIAGAHRDAWVRGANDDGAGTVALLRAAQHLGERARRDGPLEHTITLCFWDAEEFGLIGSTEWVEAHADWLAKNCIAYVNADVGVHGTHFRGASGTPGLLATLERVLRATPAAAPAEGGAAQTLWDEWTTAAAERGVHLSLPGSGSDFAGFVHHINVPMLEVGLGGSSGGQYHTTFDDFAQVERYIDPGFVGHELLGRLLRDLLTEFAVRGGDTFDGAEAAREMARLARAAGSETRGGTRENVSDETRSKDATAWLGTERAERLAHSFESAAVALATPRDAGAHVVPFYRSLALDAGVPGRAWYRNALWTPGLEDGYGSETFPTLRAAAAISDDALDAELARWIATVDALSHKD